MSLLDDLTSILLLPVNFIVIVLLLPLVLVGQALNGLTSLLGLASLIHSGELTNLVEFIRSDQSDERRRFILSGEFPNSIAVRS